MSKDKAPKRTRSAGKRSAAFDTRWDAALAAAPCFDEQWRAFVFVLDGADRDAQDYADRAALTLPQRKGFACLRKDELVAWVRETAKSKAKAKDGSPALAAEACTQAQMELDVSGDVSGEMLSRLVKARLLLMRDAALEARAAEEREKPAVLQTMDERARTPKTPGTAVKKAAGKKGKEEDAGDGLGRQREALLTRTAEEQATRVVDDDRPDDGPDCYICLVGCLDAGLTQGLEACGLALDAVVRVETTPALRERLAADAAAIAAAKPPGAAAPELPPYRDIAATHAAVRATCAAAVSGSVLRDLAWPVCTIDRIETPASLCALVAQTLYGVVALRRQYSAYQQRLAGLPVPLCPASVDLGAFHKFQTAIPASADTPAWTLAAILEALAPLPHDDVPAPAAGARTVRYGDGPEQRAAVPAAVRHAEREVLMASLAEIAQLRPDEAPVLASDALDHFGAAGTASTVWRALLDPTMEAVGRELGVASPRGLLCWEALSASTFAERLLACIARGDVLRTAYSPSVDATVVCAHAGTRQSVSSLLPVPFGFTGYLEYVLPGHVPAPQSGPISVYEVGDRLLGGTSAREAVHLGPAVLSRTVLALHDGAPSLQLLCELGDVSATLYSSQAPGGRQTRSVCIVLGDVSATIAPATLNALRGIVDLVPATIPEPSDVVQGTATPVPGKAKDAKKKKGLRESVIEEEAVKPETPPPSGRLPSAVFTPPDPSECFQVSLAFPEGSSATLLSNGSVVVAPAQPVGEAYRLFRRDGVCVRFGADGPLALLGWNGAVRTKEAAGWVGVSAAGIRSTFGGEALAPLRQADVVDVARGTTTSTREDGVVVVRDGKGGLETRLVDGTVIRATSSNDVTFSCSGYPTVKLLDGVLTLIDGGVTAECTKGKLVLRGSGALKETVTLTPTSPVAIAAGDINVALDWEGLECTARLGAAACTVSENGASSTAAGAADAAWFVLTDHASELHSHAEMAAFAAAARQLGAKSQSVVHGDGASTHTLVWPAGSGVDSLNLVREWTQHPPLADDAIVAAAGVAAQGAGVPLARAAECLHDSDDHQLFDKVYRMLHPPAPPRAQVSAGPHTLDRYLRTTTSIAALKAVIRNPVFPPYFQSPAGRAFQAAVAQQHAEAQQHAAEAVAASIMSSLGFGPAAPAPPVQPQAEAGGVRINPYTPLPPISSRPVSAS
eukprot:m.30620 g.30620  ORF g.30620 m.30620 type:complete len:1188 (+) comp4798_c0_seq1:19-3582(+)